MANIFTPAAPLLRAIADDLEPLLATGGRLTASAIGELHEQLLTVAGIARVQEALAGPEDPVSRRLFAIAGGIQKHLGQPTILDPDDAALLHQALGDCAGAMEALPEPAAGDEDDIIWGDGYPFLRVFPVAHA